jgi:hypothetical protein
MATAAVDAQSARTAIGRGILLLAENPPDRVRARALFESARAASDKQAAAEAYGRLGAMDEEEGAYARAFEEDRRCLALSPGGRIARNVRMRVDWLRARSEGDFVPLSRLWAVRRDPAFSRDPAVVEAFVQEAGGFPPGIVRSEARMAAAEAFLAMHRVDEAVPLLVAVHDDPRSLGTTIGLAEGNLVQARIEGGNLGEAANEVERRGALLEPDQAAKVRRLVRRRTMQRTAIAGLGAVAFTGVILALARRRRGRTAIARELDASER